MNKKLATLAACLALAAPAALAAFPSLTDLSAQLSNLTGQLSSLTERYADTTNRLAAISERYADATNRIAAAVRDNAALYAKLEEIYNRSESGRVQWHGKVKTWIDTNALIRVTQYADGYALTNKWSRPISQVERAMKLAEIKAQAKARALAAKTNGVPGTVAAILAEREAAADTNAVKTVTVDVVTGEKIGGDK